MLTLPAALNICMDSTFILIIVDFLAIGLHHELKIGFLCMYCVLNFNWGCDLNTNN